MSVAAYALTGYKAEEAGPLQGALNFAITNSVGAFMVLVGIALLYGRTGALNLAQIGQSLQRHPVDGLVVVSFVFIVLGFLVKGAIVPFHFWLADAHAVAPTPVCVLFSGVMVELGLYASARVYWTVFHPVLATHEAGLRGLLVGVGTVTALLGAVMALAQGHVKRLLAFSTVSHAGLFLIGFGLFETRALAGVALYVMGHALVKGALFMTVGILLHRFGVVRLRSLIAHGRAMPITGSVFGLAALGLIGMPPFVTSLGKSLIEESANDVHYRWVTLVFVVASALSGAAVLRAGAQIFLGWEAPESNPGHATDLAGRLDIEFDTVRAPERVEAFETEPVEIEHRETEEGRSPTPAVMVLPAVALVLVALLTGLLPGISRRAESAAARFVDTPANASQVLHDVVATQSAAPTAATKPAGHAAASLGGAALGVLTALLAVGVALTALGRVRASRSVTRRVRGWSRPAMAPLRRLHSGHVGDYLAWLTFGVALFGGIAAAILR